MPNQPEEKTTDDETVMAWLREAESVATDAVESLQEAIRGHLGNLPSTCAQVGRRLVECEADDPREPRGAGVAPEGEPEGKPTHCATPACRRERTGKGSRPHLCRVCAAPVGSVTWALAEIRGLGLTVSRRDGEFRVGLPGSPGADYFTSEAEDAVATARDMQARAKGSVAPAGPDLEACRVLLAELLGADFIPEEYRPEAQRALGLPVEEGTGEEE